MKDAILGRDYDLSLAFVSDDVSETLHQKFKDEDGPANVLSFPLSEVSGEIVMNLTEQERQAPVFGMKLADYTGYLFIHGLLHLKGLRHGSTMESEEQKFCKKFGIPHPLSA